MPFVESDTPALYTSENVSITIRELIDSPLGLTVVAGAEQLDAPVRWVHVSELHDPTPWLRGGELLLTTGMGIGSSPGEQRRYVGRLVEAGVVGLGFGIGFGFASAPRGIISAAEAAGLPVLEVPFPVPFVAISEAVSTHLAEERLHEAQLSLRVNERLAQLVSDGAGPADVLAEVSDMTGGWALLFDRRGEVQAGAGRHPDPMTVWSGLPEGLRRGTGPQSAADVAPGGTTVGLVVSAGKRHEGVLAFGKPAVLDPRDKIVVHHAVNVLALLLVMRRAVIDTERRVAGDVLQEIFSGRLTGEELRRRLGLLGFDGSQPVAVIAAEYDGAVGAEALEELSWRLDAALGKRVATVRTSTVNGRAVALIAGSDVAEACARAMDELAQETGGPDGVPHFGIGEEVEVTDARRSYLSAVFAIKSALTGSTADPRDLGSYSFLLASQSRPALEGFVRSVIGPMLDHDAERGSDLVGSTKAFIELGGRWEHGAERLGVHRHTLRYRVKQVETLLGRDLSNAEDRMEIWLALKALDVLGE